MTIRIGSEGIVTDSLIFSIDSAQTINYLLTEVEVLVVAGGGGGGANHAGGGGGGGVIYNSEYLVTPGSPINVVVGNGGSKSTSHTSIAAGDGQNSVFGNITSIGGGGGGNRRDGGTAGLEFGRPGGSGGGGGGQGLDQTPTNTGGLGRIGQGNSGGIGAFHAGAGGGGAGGPGQTPRGSIGSNATTTYPGNGGPGLMFNISGSPSYYGGGGGGGGFIGGPYAGVGGVGGGGDGQINGSQRVDGIVNTGGGGGGANGGGNTNGGNGGSGIVIVRYPGPRKANGGSITSVGGYTIHTFTSSGTFTPLGLPTNGSTTYGLQDFSGYNNSVYAVNGTTFRSDNGGVILFDGIDDHLETGRMVNGMGKRNQLTIEGWTKVEDTANPTSWVWVTPHTTWRGTWVTGLLYNAGTTNFRSHIRTESGVAGSSDTPGSFPVSSIKNWNCFTQVYTGSQVLIYINGSLYHTINGGTGTVVEIDNIVIGAWKDPTLRIVNPQRIASAKIYNRALSASEIQQNFNALRGRFGI